MVELKEYEPLPGGIRQFPLHFVENHRALKLRESSSEVWIGQVSPSEVASMWERFFPGKRVNLLSLDGDEFSSFVRRKFTTLAQQGRSGVGAASSPVRAVEPVVTQSAISVGSSIDDAIGSAISSQAPAVNLVNGWIMEGIRTGASDVHLESGEEGGVIRYRRDGVLQTGEIMEGDQLKRVCNRIKVMAGIDVMEARLPQEGRFSLTIGREHRDVRVSFLPSDGGVSVVLRLLGAGSGVRELEALGFPGEIEEGLHRVLQYGQGLFLVAGPTGSGKTTTLNAMLHALPRERMKVVSIEDPLEIKLHGVIQVQVNEPIGLTFSSLLRRVLRQDPDVLMVGEIRDEETAQLAVRAALTGHLVLSSIHTASVAAIPQRLVNMGVPDYLIASVLRGALSQRLIRTLCRRCSGEDAWCSGCRGLRWDGRTVIGEFLVSEPFEGELREYGRWLKKWSCSAVPTLGEVGCEFVERGITTVEELRRVGIR